jgi:hypothetical protein
MRSGRLTTTCQAFFVAGMVLAGPEAFIENIQGSGPAIYTANHLGSLGPSQAILSVPVRFYPWVVAEMMDPARAPGYLYDDFVGPELHLDGRAGIALTTVISWISVRVLGCSSRMAWAGART